MLGINVNNFIRRRNFLLLRKFCSNVKGGSGSEGLVGPTILPLSDENNGLKKVDSNLQNHDGEDEIQPYWRAMESRVTKRKSRSNREPGRIGIRKSEEDFWSEAGLYDSHEDKTKNT